MLVDLHLHTTASDGRLSPHEVAAQAKARGIGCIALTDHDTVDGYLELKTALPNGLELIPGIEFSTDLPKHEVHILGYGIDVHNETLRRYMALLRDERKTRVAKMAEKLRALSYDLTAADLTGATGRPHVAQALVKRGYFPTTHAAFDAVLGKNKPGYVPHYKLTPQDVIALVEQAGGLPVLAHPGLVGSDDVVRQLIANGIKGLEAHHPKHSAEQVAWYRELAIAHGLVISGGSDYHAIPGRYPETLGEFAIERDWLLRFPWPRAGNC